MKRIFLIGFLSVFMLTTEVNAQGKSVFVHHQETMDALGLNKEQQAEIVKIAKQTSVEISKVNKDSTLSEADVKSKKYAIYINRDKEYNKILSEEQIAKLKEMRAAAKNQ